MNLAIECLVFVVMLNALYLNVTDMGIDHEQKELTKIQNTRGLLVKRPRENYEAIH